MKRHKFKLASGIAIVLLVTSSLIKANQIPESVLKKQLKIHNQANKKNIKIIQKTEQSTNNLTYEYELALQRKLNLQQLNTSQSASEKHTNNRARIESLNTALSNTKNEKRWHIAWNAIYGLGVLNATNLSLDPDDRKEKVIANVNIGAGLLALFSQNISDYYPKLMANTAPLATNASNQEIAKAENLLRARKNFILNQRSFKSRLPSYATALGSSWIIKEEGYDNAAKLNLGMALIGIELTRRTLPLNALKSWKSYKGKFSYDLSKQSNDHKFAWNVQPHLGGFSFNAAF